MTYINKDSNILSVLPDIKYENDNYLSRYINICNEQMLVSDVTQDSSNRDEDLTVINRIINKEYLIISGKSLSSIINEENREILKKSGLTNIEYSIDLISDTYKDKFVDCKLKKIYFIDSTKARFFKNESSVIELQIKNIYEDLYGNTTVEENINYEVLPIENFEDAVKIFDNDVLLGFDYETNGEEIFSDKLLITGVGISSLTKSIFFYYPIDIGENKSIYNKYLDIVKSWLNINRNKLITYNAKFESNVTYKLFGLDIEYNDAFILCKVRQMPNSLKINAVNILGVPKWKEETEDIMVEYKSITEAIDAYREKLNNNIRKKIDCIPNIHSKITLPDNLSDDELLSIDMDKYIKENELPGRTASAIMKKYNKIIESVNSDKELLSELDHCIQNNEKLPDNPVFDKFTHILNYFSISDIYKYKKSGVTAWGVVPRDILGKYCCKDAYYTLRIWYKLYDEEIAKSYHIYRANTYLATLMERHGTYMNGSEFKKFHKLYSDELSYHYKTLLTDAGVTKSIKENRIEKYIDYIISTITLELAIKDKFNYTEDLPAYIKKDIISIGSDVRVNALLGGILKEINPALLQDETALNNNMPIIKKNLKNTARRYANDIITMNYSDYMRLYFNKDTDFIGTVKDYVDLETQELINKATTLGEFKSLYNISSTTDSNNCKILWENIMTEDMIPLSGYLFVYRQLESLFSKRYPEVISSIKSVYGEKRLKLLTDLVNNSYKGVYGDDIRSAISKIYNQGENRARELALTGGNKTDLDDALDIFKEIIIESPDDINDLYKYPNNFKLLYHYNSIKKIIKVMSTYIEGSTGIQSAYKTEIIDDSLDYPKRLEKVDNISDINDSDNLIVNIPFFDNHKATLRWASPMHSIPKLMEFNNAIYPRYDNGCIIQWDKSQAEVRLIATAAGEQGLIDACKSGFDIHHFNAANMTRKDVNIPLNAPGGVTSYERSVAKTFVLKYQAQRNSNIMLSVYN